MINEEAKKDRRRSKLHPNLKENYFEVINSKEKAYWLGFIYADGGITVDKRGIDRYRFKIEINKKDEYLIETFCKTIRFEKKYKSYHKDSNTVRIRLGNKKLLSDLISKGVCLRKSKVIELPKLNTRAFYLAFLLGYFDGDGTQGTSKITSGSKKFLQQIKEFFNLHTKIHEKSGFGHAFDLYLGSELFSEMMDNYKYSLPRKRIKFSSKEERVEKIRKNAWKHGNKRKLVIGKEKLEKLVWEIPISKIAKLYGVSDTTIINYCKRWKIEKPTQGFWIKNSSNINF
ncbi:MAG: LAGLIDADG family homing endonuclease [Promethearchaeota archaeon]